MATDYQGFDSGHKGVCTVWQKSGRTHSPIFDIRFDSFGEAIPLACSEPHRELSRAWVHVADACLEGTTMYIEEITIEGFKSYATRVNIPGFDRYFNAITGLNGTGKSNILDSICFVLGITNLSQVREPGQGK